MVQSGWVSAIETSFTALNFWPVTPEVFLTSHNKVIRWVSVLAWCGLVSCHAGTSAENGVVRLALQDDPKSLDPVIGYNVPSWAFSHLLFEGLVTYGFQNEIRPALAASWAQRGYQEWTFKLRPDARFHDGRPVTADDVVASFERLLDPATKSPGAAFYDRIRGAEARLAGRADRVSGIVALSPTTVGITLNGPDPIFLQRLAMPFAAVVPAGLRSQDLARRPIGSGPFAFDGWKSGLRLSFKRNPYSPPAGGAEGLKPIERVEVQIGVSESLEVLKFERGELDIIGALRNIPAADFARLSATPPAGSRMLSAPDAAVHYVTINSEVPPFDRREVRRAVAQAINKEKIVQLVNGRGTPAASFLPPHLPGYNPRFEGLSYDLNAARQQMLQAGMKGGFDATYACVANDTQRKVAQAIQQDLSKIGVRLTIKPMAFPTYLQAKSTRGQVAIGSGNWSQDYPDPSNFLINLFHSKHIRDANSLNDSFYSNSRVDKLFDRSEQTLDERTRFVYLQEAETIIVQDAAIVPLYHPVKYHLVAARVSGYALHPVWGLELQGAGLL